MIKFTDVSYGFPQKDLYNHICFEIEEKDHAVLIGSNGTGKTTLLNMIVNPDDYLYDGKIEKAPNIRTSYVSQFIKHEGDEISVFDFLAEPFRNMQNNADILCQEMGSAEDMDEVYERYQKCLDEIDAVDGYNHEVNIKKQLSIAGLSDLETTSIHKISGGEFKLLSIIKNMLLKPQLLIMDEPDVFLDFENIVGLSKLINNYEGALITITHSRLLLSQCFNKILHLENMELQEFPGSFAEYNQAMLETKIAMQEQSTKDEEWIQVQQQVVENLRKAATNIASPTKGKQLKARASYLSRLQARKCKNPFIEDASYDFSFPSVTTEEGHENDTVIKVTDYSLTFDKAILSDVNFEIKAGETVAIVGANGTGKSSLLKDIYNLEKAKNPDKVAYFSQIYDSDSSEKLSGGEKNIRQLKTLCESQASILFLDEPTSHLDIYAGVALEKAITEYKGTILLVSHDFYTVVNCADRIFILENGTLREMSGRAYRKSIYKKYFDSDIFEQERIRKETELKINALLKQGKYNDAKALLPMTPVAAK